MPEKSCITWGRVAPLAGAWIEIRETFNNIGPSAVAPLAGAWIEIQGVEYAKQFVDVAPLAGAWIEISCKIF